MKKLIRGEFQNKKSGNEMLHSFCYFYLLLITVFNCVFCAKNFGNSGPTYLIMKELIMHWSTCDGFISSKIESLIVS